jgi:hypothetical protein
MKSLKDYLQISNSEPKVGNDVVMEDGTMRPLKKYAQVDLAGAEGLYETNVDRWSRNAKHHFAKSELVSANDQPEFEEGDVALYEGKEVSIKIPMGPKKTIGIMVENHLKMVHQSKVIKLEEMVMGGIKSVTPLNRIMQLAGLQHSGAVEHIVEDEVLTETDAEGMLKQLVVAAQNMPQYKNNTDAAKLYVIGSVLSQIATDLNNTKFQTAGAQAKITELQPLGALGADLIKTAQTLTQVHTQAPPAPTQGQAAPVAPINPAQG